MNPVKSKLGLILLLYFSSTHRFPGARDPGGGSVFSSSCFLPGRGPSTSPAYLEHWSAGTVPGPRQRRRLRVQLVLPASTAQHEWEDAGLHGVASWPSGATQDHKLPDRSLWVCCCRLLTWAPFNWQSRTFKDNESFSHWLQVKSRIYTPQKKIKGTLK